MINKNIELTCLIDDDKIYLNLIKKIIETKALCENLIVFNDGKQSIDYFETLLKSSNKDRIPDIIFLDLNMPVMDGWQFLERFTKIKNKFNKVITLYIVSSSIYPEDINRAKSIETVEDYLIKPIIISDLAKLFGKSV